jgi:serine/threonine-protein kinase
METNHEAELCVAVAEGLLTRGDADTLRVEAQRVGRSPLRLLVERGRLSEESFASLRAVRVLPAVEPDAAAPVVEGPAVDPDATVTGAPRAIRADPEAPVFPVAHWDRYQAVRLLGQGGMGKVFLARDLRLDRDVAIKFVRGGEPTLVHRLISEARAQARVSHERVCKVYEVGEIEGEVYIAMQYIDGRSLDALAAELGVEQKALVVRDAALGVHEAHRAGLIHRDLKPSNVIVERAEDGALKAYVMDFGLARSFQGDPTETGAVLGTPAFMSPEQARGEGSRLDRRTDVYSLGASH